VVEAVQLVEGCDGDRGGLRTQLGLGRAPGQEVHKDEGDDQDAEDHHDRLADPPQKKAEHPSPPGREYVGTPDANASGVPTYSNQPAPTTRSVARSTGYFVK
jgi:hypothetical protein